jgi:GTP-binding protein EngB required for normal cell division
MSTVTACNEGPSELDDYVSIGGRSSLNAKFMDILGLVSVSTLTESFLGYMNKDFAHKLYHSVRTVVGYDPNKVATAYQYVLDFAKTLILRVTDCIKLGSLDPLYKEEMSPVEWVDTCNAFLCEPVLKEGLGTAQVFMDRKHSGAIPRFFKNRLPLDMLPAACEMLITEGKRIITYLERTGAAPNASNSIRAMLTRLTDEKYRLSATQTNGRFREQPLGIYIFGKAGTGKSSIISALTSVISAEVGVPLGPDHTFNLMTNSNFDDGFNAFTAHVVADDIDQALGNASLGQTNYAARIIDLINVKPTQIECARVEDKGKVFARPYSVTFASNQEHPDVGKYIKDPSAFYRRFQMKIETVVKPKFATPEAPIPVEHAQPMRGGRHGVNPARPPEIVVGGSIDAEKVKLYPGEDPVEYRVWLYRGGKYVLYRDSLLSRIELLTLVRDTFATYWADQVEQTKKANSVEAGICEVCGLVGSVHLHPCKIENQALSLPNAQTKYLSLKLGVPEFTDFEMSFVLAACALFATQFQGVTVVFLASLALLLTILRFKHIFSFVKGLVLLIVYRLIIKQFCPSIVLTNYISLLGLLSRDDLVDCLQLHELKRKKEAMTRLSAYAPTLKILLSVVVLLKAAHYLYRSGTTPSPAQEMLVARRKDDTANRFTVNKFAWSSVAKDPHPGVSYSNVARTTSREELSAKIRTSLWKMTTDLGTTNALRIDGDVYVANAHAFGKSDDLGRGLVLSNGDKMTIKMRKGSQIVSYEIVFGRNAFKLPMRDLVVFSCLVTAPAQKGASLLEYIPYQSLQQIKQYDSGVLIVPDSFATEVVEHLFAVGPKYSTLAGQAGLPILSYSGVTEAGDCGAPLLAVSNNDLLLVGLHFSKVTTLLNGVSCSEELIRYDIERCIVKLREHGYGNKYVSSTYELTGAFDVVDGHAETENDVHVVPLVEKSSVRVLTARQDVPFAVVGTIDEKVTNTTLKTSFRETLAHSIWRPFFVERGVPVEKFSYPIFSGTMIGDEWHDPYTVNLAAMRNVSGSPEIWDSAVVDYLTGASELSGWDLVRPLTFDEALRGVPPTIRPVDLTTSSGPPYGEPKSRHVKRDPDGDYKINADVRKHSEWV